MGAVPAGGHTAGRRAARLSEPHAENASGVFPGSTIPRGPKESRRIPAKALVPGLFLSSNSRPSVRRSRCSTAPGRASRWGCQFKNSPAVWMETIAAGRASLPVSSRRNEERAVQAHRASLGRCLRRYRNAGRRTLGIAKTRCRWGTDHPLPDEFHPKNW